MISQVCSQPSQHEPIPYLAAFGQRTVARCAHRETRPVSQTIPNTDVLNELLYLFTETFESPVKDGNAYLDRGTGIFMTLDTLSAADASKPAFPGATTIAAQTEHLRFYLVALAGFIAGAHTRVDWQESWTVTVVTSEEWDAPRLELRRS
jgi:hypothetical protein